MQATGTSCQIVHGSNCNCTRLVAAPTSATVAVPRPNYYRLLVVHRAELQLHPTCGSAYQRSLWQCPPAMQMTMRGRLLEKNSVLIRYNSWAMQR